METRSADSRGRIVLGAQYANRQFMVTEVSEGEFRIELAAVIPARESWLFENRGALDAVRNGIEDARAGRFETEGPDLDSARRLAEQIPDEEP